MAIKHFRMQFEYGRRVKRERRVDIDGNCGDLTSAMQRVQVVHQFLRTPHRKGRNKRAPAARRGFAHHASEMFTRTFDRFVIAIAVRRLHDHDIGATFWWRWIAQDG